MVMSCVARGCIYAWAEAARRVRRGIRDRWAMVRCGWRNVGGVTSGPNRTRFVTVAIAPSRTGLYEMTRVARRRVIGDPDAVKPSPMRRVHERTLGAAASMTDAHEPILSLSRPLKDDRPRIVGPQALVTAERPAYGRVIHGDDPVGRVGQAFEPIHRSGAAGNGRAVVPALKVEDRS